MSSADGLGVIIKTALGLELRYELTAMLIYVSSRVHVRVIWWIEVCLC